MTAYSIIMITFCVAFTAFAISEEKKFQKGIKNQGSVVKTIERDKGEKTFYITSCIISIIIILVCLFGMTVKKMDNLLDIIVLFLVMIALCISLYINENRSSRLYYTNKGFFLRDGFFAYKQISKIEFLSKRSARIYFKDGKEFKISAKKANNINSIRKK